MFEYDGQQFVGIDQHRHRSVILRMTQTGVHLGTVRITNDPWMLAGQIAQAGEHPVASFGRGVRRSRWLTSWRSDKGRPPTTTGNRRVYRPRSWERGAPLPATGPHRTLATVSDPDFSLHPVTGAALW